MLKSLPSQSININDCIFQGYSSTENQKHLGWQGTFSKHNFEGQLLFALCLQWVWKNCGPTLIGSLSFCALCEYSCMLNFWCESSKLSKLLNGISEGLSRKLAFWLFLCVLNLVKLYFFISETNTPYIPQFIISHSNVLLSFPLLGIRTVSTAVATSYASQMMSVVCREPRNPKDFHYRKKTNTSQKNLYRKCRKMGPKIQITRPGLLKAMWLHSEWKTKTWRTKH